MRTLIISTSELDTLTDILNIDGNDIRTDYSGRGMYGNTCLGIVLGDGVTPIQVGVALVEALTADSDDQDSVESAWQTANTIAGRARMDSMGLGSIVYFPGVTVES
jgi:hypothetical protein